MQIAPCQGACSLRNFLRILGEQRGKRDEREKRVARFERGAEKLTSVRIPLFELFQRSNVNAATQLVTLHHVILECFSKPLHD